MREHIPVWIASQWRWRFPTPRALQSKAHPVMSWVDEPCRLLPKFYFHIYRQDLRNTAIAHNSSLLFSLAAKDTRITKLLCGAKCNLVRDYVTSSYKHRPTGNIAPKILHFGSHFNRTQTARLTLRSIRLPHSPSGRHFCFNRRYTSTFYIFSDNSAASIFISSR